MTKQLVVVVHGVGVKEAGVSSDLLATALDDNRLLPEASDDFHINEIDDYVEDSKRKIFPCRIRRYKNTRDERVIADFYWGDISNSGSGALGLLIAIVKTVLGIGHTIRENAKGIYGAGSWLERIADWIVRLIHGPIAAINLVMLAGVGLYWLAEKAGGDPNTAYVSSFLTGNAGIVTGVILGVFALWRRSKHMSFLGRLLWGWVVIVCLFLLVSEAVNFRTSWKDAFAGIDATVNVFLCKEPPAQKAAFESQSLCKQVAASCALPEKDCATYLASGIFVSGGRLLVIANLFWVLAIWLNATLVAATAIQGMRRRLPSAPLLAPIASSGMTFFWLLFITCVWTAPSAMGWKLLPHPEMLNSALEIATAVAIILGALLAIAVIVLIRKSLWTCRAGRIKTQELHAWYFGPENGRSTRQGKQQSASHRLIVNFWFSWLFLLGIFFLTYCATAILINVIDGVAIKIAKGASASSALESTPWLWVKATGLWVKATGWAGSTAGWLGEYSKAALLAFGVIGVILFAWFRDELKAALDILTDVITYVNDYSWRWGTEERSKTLLDRLPSRAGAFFRLKKDPRYHPRKRIQDRLRVLVKKLLKEQQPDEMFIVSHSQGTVIAIDVIAKKGGDWLASMGSKGSIGLVTMGSPYTHIHGHYFPSSFEPLSKRPELAGARDGKKVRVLSSWDNIFRVDDFVGTHIDPEGIWPVEHPVSPNGHTYYWIDTNVAPILKNVLNFGSGKPAKRRAGGKAKM